MDPSIILEVYTPQIIDGHESVNYMGGLHPPNLTDMVPSIIWGVYTPRIIHGHGSVDIFGGVDPQNN